MSSGIQTTRLTVHINAGPDADTAERETLTRQLREELIDLEVDSIDLSHAGETPPGAKAGDVIAWGDLILALVASGGVLTTLIGAIQSWLTRHERRSVTLEIDGDKLEVTGTAPEEQRRLIEAWIRHHSGDATLGASPMGPPIVE